jgi:hypothetical protein
MTLLMLLPSCISSNSVRRRRLAGIGLAAGLTDPTAGLGAVGGYAALELSAAGHRPRADVPKLRGEER